VDPKAAEDVMADLWLPTLAMGAATAAMTAIAARAWRGQSAEAKVEAKQPAGSLVERIAPLGGVLRPKDQGELDSLRARLAAAGMRDPSALDLYLAIRVMALFGGLLLGMLLGLRADEPLAGFLLALIFIALGVVGPSFWLDARARERRAQIEISLSGAVDLLVTCIDAGLSLEGALARVGDELGHSSPVLADEFMVVVRELEAGVPVATAVRRMGKRVGLEELDTLCAVVGQASQLGARVGQTLRDYAATSRKRRMAELDERAGKIGAALTLPLAVCLLPASLLVMLGPAIIVVLRTLGG
jgi:tight adherence protein C